MGNKSKKGHWAPQRVRTQGVQVKKWMPSGGKRGWSDMDDEKIERQNRFIIGLVCNICLSLITTLLVLKAVEL